jgi:hypothetical protein
MLPRLQRRDGVLGVQSVGRADVDGIDLRSDFSEHLLVIGEGPDFAEFLLELFDRHVADVGDGDDLHVLQGFEILDVAPRDPAGADERDTKRFTHGRIC